MQQDNRGEGGEEVDSSVKKEAEQLSMIAATAKPVLCHTTCYSESSRSESSRDWKMKTQGAQAANRRQDLDCASMPSKLATASVSLVALALSLASRSQRLSPFAHRLQLPHHHVYRTWSEKYTTIPQILREKHVWLYPSIRP